MTNPYQKFGVKPSYSTGQATSRRMAGRFPVATQIKKCPTYVGHFD